MLKRLGWGQHDLIVASNHPAMIMLSRSCLYNYSCFCVCHISQVDGRYSVRIPTSSYHNTVRYRYDPFCVRSSIKLVAEVEESGRGTKISKSHTFHLAHSSVVVKFADENPKVFRPGMMYSMKVWRLEYSSLVPSLPDLLGTRLRILPCSLHVCVIAWELTTFTSLYCTGMTTYQLDQVVIEHYSNCW